MKSKEVKITAKYLDSCLVLLKGKLVASGVPFEWSKEQYPEALILQSYVDSDGYIGYSNKPYRCGEEE